LVSQLEELEGIGKLTAQKLLKHFGTIRQMYDAPIEEVEKVAGKAKTPMLRKQIKIWLDEKA
jgi:excinuclease ABC subunit C